MRLRISLLLVATAPLAGEEQRSDAIDHYLQSDFTPTDPWNRVRNLRRPPSAAEGYTAVAMNPHPNITLNPAVMGGKPCIRGKRVTVGTILGLMAAGKSHDAIVAEYPYLSRQDLQDALGYAAWRLEEAELPLTGA